MPEILTSPQEVFTTPLAALTSTIGCVVPGVDGGGAPSSTAADDSTVPMPGRNCSATSAVTPLPMAALDALSVHTKMSLIHAVVTYVNKVIASKTALALAPALVETYCR